MTELHIDPEFRDKIPPLTEAEFKQLEDNIVSDGEVREPIITWNGTIVDGHHRWKIIQKHPEIPYKVKELEFADRYAAIVWVCQNQLGRRNLTDEQKTYLIGKEYEAQKKTHGNNAERGEDGKYLSGQNGQTGGAQDEQTETRKRIAQEHEIGERSVSRAEHFAHGLDAAETVFPGFKDAVLTGAVKAPKSVIAEIAKIPEPERKETVEAIQAGELKKKQAEAAKAKKTREQNKLIEKIAADLKNMDKPSYNPDDIASDISQMVATFRQNLKAHLTMHATEITEENSKKIIAALSEAETAIAEMKGLVER